MDELEKRARLIAAAPWAYSSRDVSAIIEELLALASPRSLPYDDPEGED